MQPYVTNYLEHVFGIDSNVTSQRQVDQLGNSTHHRLNVQYTVRRNAGQGHTAIIYVPVSIVREN